MGRLLGWSGGASFSKLAMLRTTASRILGGRVRDPLLDPPAPVLSVPCLALPLFRSSLFLSFRSLPFRSFISLPSLTVPFPPLASSFLSFLSFPCSYSRSWLSSQHSQHAARRQACSRWCLRQKAVSEHVATGLAPGFPATGPRRDEQQSPCFGLWASLLVSAAAAAVVFRRLPWSGLAVALCGQIQPNGNHDKSTNATSPHNGSTRGGDVYSKGRPWAMFRQFGRLLQLSHQATPCHEVPPEQLQVLISSRRLTFSSTKDHLELSSLDHTPQLYMLLLALNLFETKPDETTKLPGDAISTDRRRGTR